MTEAYLDRQVLIMEAGKMAAARSAPVVRQSAGYCGETLVSTKRRQAATAIGTRGEAPQPKESEVRCLSVLLIEDSPGDAALIMQMLGSLKSVISVAVSPRFADGIARLRDNRADVVLLDLNLPDSAGLATVAELVQAAPEATVIVLTGATDEALGRAAVKLGAQDFLVKGEVDGRLLLRTAHHAIERKKMEVELKHANEQLAQLATTDPLTGLFNRRKGEDVLRVEIDRARRYGVPLSVVMFDIDHFKRVNDRCGHQAGDVVLRRIARLVAGQTRSTDCVVRWGGEEFLVVVTHKDLRLARAFAEKVRASISGADFGDGLTASASFGVVEFRADDGLETLIGRADAAMCLAKNGGRNRIESL